jgi:hypothetical protein
MNTSTKITVSRSDFQMEKLDDAFPDTSWIGEYTNDWKEGAIDRQERGDWDRREYRYFIPATEYAEQDYQRMESLSRGAWSFIGIRASVEIKIPSKQGGYWTTQTIHAPGVWGIESDSGTDYFDEVFREESEALAEMLEALAVEVTE